MPRQQKGQIPRFKFNAKARAHAFEIVEIAQAAIKNNGIADDEISYLEMRLSDLKKEHQFAKQKTR